MVIGLNHNNGLAFANNPEELVNYILVTSGVFATKYFNEEAAYTEMIQMYERQGIPLHQVLPGPQLESLSKWRFFSTADQDAVFTLNTAKERFFVLWNRDHYGIFTDLESLVDTFFLPEYNFILKETASVDEAVTFIYEMYAGLTFHLFPYCGGNQLPTIVGQYTLNQLFIAPYRKFVSESCILPDNLSGLNRFIESDPLLPLAQSGYLMQAEETAYGRKRPNNLEIATIVKNAITTEGIKPQSQLYSEDLKASDNYNSLRGDEELKGLKLREIVEIIN